MHHITMCWWTNKMHKFLQTIFIFPIFYLLYMFRTNHPSIIRSTVLLNCITQFVHSCNQASLAAAAARLVHLVRPSTHYTYRLGCSCKTAVSEWQLFQPSPCPTATTFSTYENFSSLDLGHSNWCGVKQSVRVLYHIPTLFLWSSSEQLTPNTPHSLSQSFSLFVFFWFVIWCDIVLLTWKALRTLW